MNAESQPNDQIKPIIDHIADVLHSKCPVSEEMSRDIASQLVEEVCRHCFDLVSISDDYMIHAANQQGAFISANSTHFEEHPGQLTLVEVYSL